MFQVVRLAFAFVTLTSAAFAHGDGNLRVEIESESNSTVKNEEVEYRFQLVDTKSNKLIEEKDLRITHERKLHMLVYDPSLNEFQHVHPEAKENLWSVRMSFHRSGEYWIWAQGKLLDEVEFSSPTRIKVEVREPAWPVPPKLTDVRRGSDSISVATLSNEKLRSGRMAMLNVVLSRSDGTPAQISPYLGAFAHVVAVFEDSDSLVHVHPMDTADPTKGMLHVTFPHKGKYRLWIQFVDGGQLRTVPLSVQVF